MISGCKTILAPAGSCQQTHLPPNTEKMAEKPYYHIRPNRRTVWVQVSVKCTRRGAGEIPFNRTI